MSKTPDMNLDRARRLVRQMEAAATSYNDLRNSRAYAKAKQLVTENEGPWDGHQFIISVGGRMASSVVGDPDSYRDADWECEPSTVAVRASSLAEACRKASLLPLTAWAHPWDEETPDV